MQIFTGLLICLCIFNTSCEHNEVYEFIHTVDFDDALLETFQLSEVDINLNTDSVQIKQPKLLNGIPQTRGEITIALKNTEINNFSLKQVDFNNSDFTISPTVGEK